LKADAAAFVLSECAKLEISGDIFKSIKMLKHFLGSFAPYYPHDFLELCSQFNFNFF